MTLPSGKRNVLSAENFTCPSQVKHIALTLAGYGQDGRRIKSASVGYAKIRGDVSAT